MAAAFEPQVLAGRERAQPSTGPWRKSVQSVLGQTRIDSHAGLLVAELTDRQSS